MPRPRDTRLVALLGDPVSHSLSPTFQNAAFRAAGVPAVYLALRASAADLPGLLLGIARAGGAGNVTLPHKALAASVVERVTDAVVRTGACNTFWLEGDRVVGDNTDVLGFRAAVRALLGTEARGARVLLLGAGGAARAVIAALQEDGAASIEIANRTPEAARRIVSEMVGGATRLAVLPGSPPPAGSASYDLVVNATSLGLSGEGTPLPPGWVRHGTAVLDLVYRTGGTPWVRDLRRRGVPAADGTEMLLQQGAAAFERWWGDPAPLEAMREALEGRA